MPNNKFLVPLAIIVAGLLIAGSIYFGSAKLPQTAVDDRNIEEEIIIEPVSTDDHILGDPNAPVVIIEYSDLECPFCKVFHSTMKQVMEEYGPQVAWVFRHFPIAQLHARAHKEAEATECAAELGGNQAFWKYMDTVFEITSSNDSLDPTELPRIAIETGLDVDTFNQCLESGKYTEAVNESVREAIKAGARGTPYFVIAFNKPLTNDKIASIKNMIPKYNLYDREGNPLINVFPNQNHISVSGAMPLNILQEMVENIVQ